MKDTASRHPLRVRIVTPFGALGGAEQWLLALLEATDRLTVDVVCLSDGPLIAQLLEREIATSVLPTGPSGRAVMAASRKLTRDLRMDRPDVVLANGVKAALAVAPACCLTGTPLVWAKHDFSFDSTLARPLGMVVDRVVAAVDELGEAVRRNDVVIIEPPRPPRPPAARADARAFWAARGMSWDGAPYAVTAGRLVPYKGVDDAIAALPAAHPWRLVVVGDDDSTSHERERLERLAREIGVGDRVMFTGWVPDARHWLAAFDALLLLTKRDGRRYGREGFGTVAMEAMLAGVPVVATDDGGVASRLAGGTGYVVPPNTPQAVARALNELSDPVVNERVAAAARDLVADHPDAATCASRLVAVLAEAALRPGAGSTGTHPVSVISPVLNEGIELDRVASQVVAQLRPGDEYLIVEAGSTDDTRERAERWARRCPQVRVVAWSGPGTLNVARGRNRGITEARNEVVAFTDAGCTPVPGWLEALRRPFNDEPPPDFVAGVYRVSAKDPFQMATAAAAYPNPDEALRPTLLSRSYGRLFGRTFDPRVPGGRSMAFTRSVWRSAKGFQEDIPTNEDVVFAHAVAANGGRCVLQAEAEVAWEQAPRPFQTLRMWYRYGRGDGLSANKLAVSRDLVRAVAYPVGALLATRFGREARLAAITGGLAYLSLPVARARRSPRPAMTVALVPVALATKDLGLAAGCIVGLSGGIWRRAVETGRNGPRRRP